MILYNTRHGKGRKTGKIKIEKILTKQRRSDIL